MAKTKLAKRNPPEPKKKSGVIKLCLNDHFSCHIIKTSKFKIVVKTIRRKLWCRQLLLFKSDIFWHAMDLDSYAFSCVIIHNLLLRQIAHKEVNENQLWFQIREHLIRLSIGEWCLITRLSNGLNVLLKNMKAHHRMFDKYFGGRSKDLNLKKLDARFCALNFRAMDHIDALKIALYYFAYRILNKRKDNRQADF